MITTLPLCGEINVIGLILKGKDDDKLQRLTTAISYSKARLPTNLHMDRGFITLMREMGVVAGSFWMHWLSQFIFPSWLEDGLNSCVFFANDPFGKREYGGLGPNYLGSSYARLDGCVANMAQSLAHYHVVSYVDLPFFTIVLVGTLQDSCR